MAGQRPIPEDTAAVLTNETLSHCHNLGLLLDRFNPWERYAEEERGRELTLWDLTFRIQEKKRGKWQPVEERRGNEAKGLWFSDQRGDDRTRLLDEPLLRRSHIDVALLDAHRTRWEQLVAHHGGDKNSGLCFDLQTTSRLVVGLGSESVLETAITLHRIYGFPVIPGSALKGLTRSWALLELAAALGVPALDYEQFQAYKGPKVEKKRPTPLNRLEALLETDINADDEKQWKALQGDLDALKREQPVQDAGGDILAMGLADFSSHQGVQDFRSIFGYLGQAGGAVFFDAIPVREPPLVGDVMNVHYPDYYRAEEGKVPPSDDQHPNPVSFLAVDEEALFRFAVGGRRWNNPDDLACAKKARAWLEQALCEAGIGAKTTSGYGYWGSAEELRLTAPVVPPGYQRGTVKVFGLGESRSYGFITPADAGPDVFVHQTGLAEGVSTLKEGQEVIFKVVQTPKGKQAEDTRLVEDSGR